MGIYLSVAVIIVCTSSGILLSSAIRRRCNELELILTMLNELYGRIQYSGQRINSIMSDIFKEEIYHKCCFVRSASDSFDKCGEISLLWTTAAANTMFISDYEREILVKIGQQIGCSDTESQLSMLAMNISLLRNSMASAEKDKEIKSKTIISVWTLCGIGVGIMLI